MTAPQKRDSIAGYALAFAAVIIAMIVIALSNNADAGGFRQAACAPRVVHQQAAVVAAVPYPVAGFQVGQYLQQQAVEEYAFRRSPSKDRLTFLEGYYQAKQEEIQPPAEPVQAPTVGTTCPDCEKPTEPQAFSAPQRFLESTGEPLPPDVHESFSETHPLLMANCTACHVDDQSKGGFGIAAATHAAQVNKDAEAILGLITPIAARTMPKGKEMTDTERIDAINELLGK